MKFQVLRPATLLKKTPEKVLSCEFCEVSKNTYFAEYLQIAASELVKY